MCARDCEELEMGPFVYDSAEFQRELDESPHLAGEVRFITSIAGPGMRVIEVGANRGVTAVALARRVGTQGHVYAFEPVPEFYDIVKENLSRNGVDNVSVYRKALSNSTATIPFFKHGGGSGIAPVEEADAIHVQTTTIDRFVAEQAIERIDIVNMDCEGSELNVLLGARGLLAEHRPQIFCEIHHEYLSQLDQSAAQIVAYLGSLGYDIEPSDVESPRKRPTIAECSHIYARTSRRIS
jgi:FkbM family methyltransferase